ncbi:uncharacterized protein UV8b_03765 [Ustilaginoidea virens]|uniref:Uncharacterized protein n=1 Tax=Ustilaginoidea virens TaxID=1159556 RepID=A0A8E5HQ74_USTVR|nr:uncharacterized protein UV8b_03765 [Ustilaginoidea virens]QUC19524.1 hypothetical protein UV8b_03765 [Ustilaginoidea virens]
MLHHQQDQHAAVPSRPPESQTFVLGSCSRVASVIPGQPAPFASRPQDVIPGQYHAMKHKRNISRSGRDSVEIPGSFGPSFSRDAVVAYNGETWRKRKTPVVKPTNSAQSSDAVLQHVSLDSSAFLGFSPAYENKTSNMGSASIANHALAQ